MVNINKIKKFCNKYKFTELENQRINSLFHSICLEYNVNPKKCILSPTLVDYEKKAVLKRIYIPEERFGSYKLVLTIYKISGQLKFLYE